MAIVNMFSLARIREILDSDPLFAKPTTRPLFIDVAPRESLPSGMHVEAPRASVRITTTPVMKDDTAR